VASAFRTRSATSWRKSTARPDRRRLVAHSWGAFPATAAAHRLLGRVTKVVYFSAPVPAQGASQNDLLSPENAEYARALVAGNPDGTMPLPFEAFQQVIMQNEPEQAQRIVLARSNVEATSEPTPLRAVKAGATCSMMRTGRRACETSAPRTTSSGA